MTKLTVGNMSSHFANQEDRPDGCIRHMDDLPLVFWTVTQSGNITKYKRADISTSLNVTKWFIPGMDVTPRESQPFIPVIQYRNDQQFNGRYVIPGLEQWEMDIENSIMLTNFYPSAYGVVTNLDENQKPVMSPDFQAFSNKKDAEAYSRYMKGNVEYLASVKRWHNHCSEVFSDVEDLWEEDI